jgi:hypothetical protein
MTPYWNDPDPVSENLEHDDYSEEFPYEVWAAQLYLSYRVGQYQTMDEAISGYADRVVEGQEHEEIGYSAEPTAWCKVVNGQRYCLPQFTGWRDSNSGHWKVVEILT